MLKYTDGELRGKIKDISSEFQLERQDDERQYEGNDIGDDHRRRIDVKAVGYPQEEPGTEGREHP